MLRNRSVFKTNVCGAWKQVLLFVKKIGDPEHPLPLLNFDHVEAKARTAFV